MIFGHLESFPIKNSTKKVKIYVPHLIRKIALPVLIPILSIIFFYSTGDTMRNTNPLVLIGFFILPVFIEIMVILNVRATDKRIERMRNGELMSKTGEVYLLSKEWTNDPKGGNSYRLAIKGRDENGRSFDEIYNISDSIYYNHIQHYTNGRRSVFREPRSGPAYLVEIIFLPPVDLPEFSRYKHPKKSKNKTKPVADCFAKLPISNSEVIKVIYKKSWTIFAL